MKDWFVRAYTVVTWFDPRLWLPGWFDRTFGPVIVGTVTAVAETSAAAVGSVRAKKRGPFYERLVEWAPEKPEEPSAPRPRHEPEPVAAVPAPRRAARHVAPPFTEPRFTAPRPRTIQRVVAEVPDYLAPARWEDTLTRENQYRAATLMSHVVAVLDAEEGE